MRSILFGKAKPKIMERTRLSVPTIDNFYEDAETAHLLTSLRETSDRERLLFTDPFESYPVNSDG